MSDVGQVEAAEARMNAAREALLSYVEQREGLDPGQYRRLVARVKRAEADFMKAVSGNG